jgi:hypothetical protein
VWDECTIVGSRSARLLVYTPRDVNISVYGSPYWPDAMFALYLDGTLIGKGKDWGWPNTDPFGLVVDTYHNAELDSWRVNLSQYSGQYRKIKIEGRCYLDNPCPINESSHSGLIRFSAGFSGGGGTYIDGNASDYPISCSGSGGYGRADPESGKLIGTIEYDNVTGLWTTS